MEVQKKVVSPSVSEIFSAMSYGPAPESDKVAQAWLDDHGRKFGHFINNEWVLPDGRKSYTTKSPADGKVLADTIQGCLLCLFKLPKLFQQSSYFREQRRRVRRSGGRWQGLQKLERSVRPC